MLKLIGNFNLGSDATVSTVSSKQVVNFSICHSESYKDSSGVLHEQSTWANASWWVERTTIAQYLKKGTQVLIDGVPSVKTYVNKNGVTVAQLNIRVNSLQLLSKPKEQVPQDTTQTDSNIPPTSHDPLNVDDLPF